MAEQGGNVTVAREDEFIRYQFASGAVRVMLPVNSVGPLPLGCVVVLPPEEPPVVVVPPPVDGEGALASWVQPEPFHRNHTPGETEVFSAYSAPPDTSMTAASPPSADAPLRRT
jgi:hypothetical protein